MPKRQLPKSLHSPLYTRFLERIKRARTDSRLTQVEVSELIGKPQSFVSKCESGERRVDIAEFLYLCEVYRVDPCEIIREISTGLPEP